MADARWWKAALFAAIGASAMGPVLYHQCTADALRASGVHTAARIVSIEDTRAIRGGSEIEARIVVELEHEGRVVRGEIVERVANVDLPRHQPGAMIDVVVDPDDPTRIALAR